MKIRVIFIGDSFSLGDKQRLESFILRITGKAVRILKINNKTICFTVYRFKGKTNSGFTKTKDWIEITIPPGKIDYKDLDGMLYHEIHHIARGYSAMMEKGEHVLLNTIFSEGLATAFEIEQVPSRLPEYAKHNSILIKTWLPRIVKEFLSKNYSYAEWFHGDKKPDKLGYKIGKYLVDEIIKRNPSKTPTNLVGVSSKELLKMSGYKKAQ